jgi:serine/threonine protein kinase
MKPEVKAMAADSWHEDEASDNHFADEDSEDWLDLSELQVGYRPIPGSAYVLTQRLDDGSSGFGAVWKAHNTRLNRTVVFKFCKDPLDRPSILTLHNELRLVQEFAHSGIVKLEAEYLDNPIPFLQYEYVDGVDFGKLLEGRFSDGGAGPLTPDHAATIILKLADILAFAHSKQTPIVHRDIKPQNILVTNHRELSIFKELGVHPDLRLAELKIMDFGIGAHSRYGKGAATGGQSMGIYFRRFRDPHYASLQQHMGLPAHESDDVFALGVMWYELLTGQLRQGPPIGRGWSPKRNELRLRGMTQEHLDLLEDCLELSREARIQNASELSDLIRFSYKNVMNLPSFCSALSSVLSAKEHDRITLNSPATLSPEVAQALAQWKGEYLSLDGLTTLSVEVAEALATWTGRWLKLNGLTSLSLEVAEALATWTGRHLYFDGLSSLSEEVAEALATWTGMSLELDGLTSLSPEVAQALAQWKGGFLDLNGLRSLSPDAANALAMWTGKDLSLDGLTSLSVEVAEALSKGGWRELSLDGIPSLSVEVAEALAMWKGESISLDGLTSLSVEVAEALSKGEWRERFLGLRSLSLEVAEALAKGNGEMLGLDGLTSLSVEVVEALARWKGTEINLIGLTSLSEEVAEALARWKGTLPHLNLDLIVEVLPDCPGLLHTASEHCGLGMVECLLDYAQCDPNVRNQNGWPPLLLASRHRHWEIVELLIFRGADPNLTTPDDGNTSLHVAAMAGNAELVQLLLKMGADARMGNLEGTTPLHCAVDSGDIETIRLLEQAT